jgi:hypothetical protein
MSKQVIDFVREASRRGLPSTTTRHGTPRPNESNVSAQAEPPPSVPLFDWPPEMIQRLARIRVLMRHAGVFEQHLKARLCHFPDSVHSVVLSERARSVGLLVMGAPGRGKSYLASALVRIAVLLGVPARSALAGDILSEIRETYRDDAPRSERAVVDDLSALGLLVLDDLGHEGSRDGRSSEYTLAVLHRVLTRRAGMLRPTVVTTNRQLRELELCYDGAVLSRLRAFDLLVLRGPDRRAS